MFLSIVLKYLIIKVMIYQKYVRLWAPILVISMPLMVKIFIF